MKKTSFQLLLAAALAAGVPVHAGPAARAPLAFTVDALQSDTTAEALAAERRTAAAIRARHSVAELYPATDIGFARDVAIDEKVTSVLSRRYGREFGSVTAPVSQPVDLDYATMERIFGKRGQLRLTYTLSREQRSLAERTPLMRYGAVALSVQDVLRRQNVQGRMEFFAHNLGYMHAQARAYVASLHLRDWATRRFGAQAIADLRQVLADQDDVRAGMVLYGLAEGAESENTILAALARQVTAADIDAWYSAHRDQFHRIERVRARHITVSTEALAQELMAKVAAGARFDDLARRHSIAPDAARGGQLGWIKPSATPEWLDSLALMQPLAKVSGPFRTPVGPDEKASWEILLVEKRIEGFHPRQSDTVRYEARKAIAAARARQQFAALTAGKP